MNTSAKRAITCSLHKILNRPFDCPISSTASTTSRTWKMIELDRELAKERLLPGISDSDLDFDPHDEFSPGSPLIHQH